MQHGCNTFCFTDSTLTILAFEASYIKNTIDLKDKAGQFKETTGA